MAMAPMPLDSVFQSSVNWEQVLHHPLFLEAKKAAKSAFEEREQFIRKHPDVCGAGPDQAARQAFLHVLNGE